MSSFNRTTFNTSREMEFFNEKELQMRLGYGKRDWPIVLLKELIDNSLDACENAGIQPDIEIVLEADSFSVLDNGLGIQAATVEESLKYLTRTSDKSYYVSPTRGQLGNALKCLWAAPFVADGKLGQVEVSANGTTHCIEVRLDSIAQRPKINHTTNPSLVKTGTFIKIYWPEIASYHGGSIPQGFYNLVRDFCWLNPHAKLVMKLLEHETAVFENAVPDCQKWSTNQPTSPHWYDVNQFRSLIAAYLGDSQITGKQRPIREFVAEFAGLTGTGKQKLVLDQLQMSGAYLDHLIKGEAIDSEKVARLLDAMKENSRLITPKNLGAITEKHMSQWLESFCDLIRYKKAERTIEGLPYLVEVAFGVQKAKDNDLLIKVGLNWSPTLKNPIHELNKILDECRIDDYDSIVLLVHIACPHFNFTETGKGALILPEEILADLRSAISTATKQWKQLKRSSDRDNRIKQQRLNEIIKANSSKSLTIKDAAYHSMEEAYLKASANGTLPANARQAMYAARPLVLELTGGKCWDNSNYFTQSLLPKFMEEYPGLTADWDVVFDARGRLVEPHTQRRTDLGTLEVRQYLEDWQSTISDKPEVTVDYSCKTSGHANRYNYVLFIEKEGFSSLLQQSNIANRYDIAIMSTKGMTVVASRSLVEALSQQGITVLVLHDFDKSGFSIANTLQSDSRRYKYSTLPRVVDVGLRLTDVQELGLTSEPVEYTGTINPAVNLRDSGATPEECNFLVRTHQGGKWVGERVELNAMPSNVFISWLESKFKALGVTKVVPDEKTLGIAYRRACLLAMAQRLIDDFIAGADDIDTKIPEGLTDVIAKSIDGTDFSWDEAIGNLAKETRAQAEG